MAVSLSSFKTTFTLMLITVHLSGCVQAVSVPTDITVGVLVSTDGAMRNAMEIIRYALAVGKAMYLPNTSVRYENFQYYLLIVNVAHGVCGRLFVT